MPAVCPRSPSVVAAPRRLAVMSSASGPTTTRSSLHRSLLFTVAYEMLGSAADAEDVLQESWLRWAAVDQRQMRDPRAYLVRIVTRQALNHLRTVLAASRGLRRRVAARSRC